MKTDWISDFIYHMVGPYCASQIEFSCFLNKSMSLINLNRQSNCNSIQTRLVADHTNRLLIVKHTSNHHFTQLDKTKLKFHVLLPS